MATRSFVLVNVHELQIEAREDPITYYIKYQLDVNTSIWHSLAFAIAMNIAIDCSPIDKNARTIAAAREWGWKNRKEIDDKYLSNW